MQRKITLLALAAGSFILSSCTSLLQTQTSLQKATGQLPPRAYVLNLPQNSDRIKTTFYGGGNMLVTNPNPWGTRYKDYVFTDFDITTTVFKKNAPTHNGGSKNLIMDIFTPKNDAEKKRPCILYIFGGGFSMKVDDCTTEICKGMAQKGYVVAAMDYRIGFPNELLAGQCQGDYNKGFYPAVVRAVQDARSAVRYLKANAEQLGIDPNKIFVGGQSAGAITSLGLVLYEDKDFPVEVLGQAQGTLDPMKDYMQYDTKVAGIFPLAGAIITPSVLTKKTSTPICLITGSCDELIDPYIGTAYKCKQKNTFPDIAGGAAIYEAMKNINTVKLNLICGGGHGMGSVGFNKLLDLVSNFTYSVLNGKPQSGKEIIPADAPVCTDINTCK
ncbi:MAG: hypothetical protein RL222_1479 [Bacteroidota bacterium]|mgnify:FL=1|jgi:dienelactone hydrolase